MIRERDGVLVRNLVAEVPKEVILEKGDDEICSNYIGDGHTAAEEFEGRERNKLLTRKFVQGQTRRKQDWKISPRKHRLTGNLNFRDWLPRHVLAISSLSGVISEQPEADFELDPGDPDEQDEFTKDIRDYSVSKSSGWTDDMTMRLNRFPSLQGQALQG